MLSRLWLVLAVGCAHDPRTPSQGAGAMSYPPPDAWPAWGPVPASLPSGEPVTPFPVLPASRDRTPGVAGTPVADHSKDDRRRDDPGAPGAPREGGGLPAVALAWALPGWAASLIAGTLLASVGVQFAGPNGALTQALGEVGLWAGMIGTVLFVCRRYGTGNMARDIGLRLRPTDLLVGVVTAVVALVGSLVVEAAFAHTRFSGTNTQILSGQKGNDAGLVVVSVLVSLGAPFFEEVFFRGYLRTAMRSVLGPNGAVFGQAACFALAHLGEVSGWGNVSVLTALFLVGVVFGYASKFTGRLAPSMVAHGLFNLVAVLTVV